MSTNLNENEEIQKKVFTKWCNAYLSKINNEVTDLFSDFSDGVLLSELLKILYGKTIGDPSNNQLKTHQIRNVARAMEFLKRQSDRFKYVPYSAESIVNKNPTVILAFFKALILSVEVDNITFCSSETNTKKHGESALLLWSQEKTNGYQKVNVSNFTTSWSSGLALNALIHAHYPHLVNYDQLKINEHIKNINNALNLNELNFGIPKLLKAEEIDVENPDKTSIIIYVSSMYHFIDKNNINDVKSEPGQNAKNESSSKIKRLSSFFGKLHQPQKPDVKENNYAKETNVSENIRKSNIVIRGFNKFFNSWLKNVNDLPAYRFPKKYFLYDTNVNALGIDLGTSSCYAAVNRKNRIEIVALDNCGQRILPSYVSFDEQDAKCGKYVVDHLETFAKFTVFDSKRLIGKHFDDILIDPTWPFEVVRNRKDLLIQVKNFDGIMILKSPEEIASVLLTQIKLKVNDYQGRNLTTVVIAIPASFTESQKEATITAGRLAGWEKIHLIPEPVAASFAYFIDRPIPNNATILLFDLGGGTLDICIFKVNNSQMQIISNTGDPSIGGRDFDKVLFNYFKQKLLSLYNIDVEKRKQTYRLMLECQEIKHLLTARDDESLDVDIFDMNTEGFIRLNRDEFEKKSNPLIEEMKILLQHALTEAKLKAHQIDKIFHVGGSCRMPMIKNMLKQMFPRAQHCCEEHPDEVVALGAAYYSYHLECEKKLL